MKREQDTLFFSLVIPAHNEEQFIRDTLVHLEAQRYPKDKYEILVIENGSTDHTYDVAKQFESDSVQVLAHTQKGVSFARNKGTEMARADGDWIVYVDADTLLAPEFLQELSNFLLQNKSKGYVMGTPSVRPNPSSLFREVFFLWINFVRSFKKTPYTVFCIRTDIAKQLAYTDEKREVGEDVALCNTALMYGPGFFIATPNVLTSMRRFDKAGWVKMLLYWLFVMPMPSFMQRRLHYKVIR